MNMILIVGLLVGAVAGLVGALCGVGGGIILVPVFVKLLGLSQKQAVATSLAVIIPASLSATIRNAGTSSLINWELAAVAALAAVVAAWFGSDLMKQLSNPLLTRIFAVLLILVGAQMLLGDVFAKK